MRRLHALTIPTQSMFSVGSHCLSDVENQPVPQADSLTACLCSVHRNAATNQVEVSSAVYRVTAVSPGMVSLAGMPLAFMHTVYVSLKQKSAVARMHARTGI